MRSQEDDELKEIIKSAEHDFPEDPALQQIHIARGIISREAMNAGMSFAEYVRFESRTIEKIQRSA